jgi:oxalate decarboxylase/phosphoglucose isomerase-like protein (cupin superfamily)
VPEQAYISVSGNGHIEIGYETADVQAGVLLYIPSNFEHATMQDWRNLSISTLRYLLLTYRQCMTRVSSINSVLTLTVFPV